MRFGEPSTRTGWRRCCAPAGGIDTVMTADAYGAGEADALLGRALAGVAREEYCLVGAIGHDFYTGERDGAKGFPRFTDPRLRGPDGYADYVRMATERSLERCGADAFDLLLLHNPDRTGYTSETVWDALEAVRADGLAGALGVAPGPANGFTLDLIDCFERFGERIDWAMVILNPLEPWPGELVLDAARRHGVRLITRVVDYGGLFHDDVLPGHPFPRWDHRSFRPQGWVERGREQMERMRPIAERHGLTMLQLACAWNLAHEPVACVAPTLIQEPGDDARPIEDKRAELAARARPGPDGRRGGRDPRDRRQHRLHGAQGRRARLRGRPAARPLAAQRRAVGARRPLGDRPPPRPRARGLSQLGGPVEPRTTRLVGSSSLGPGGPGLSSRSAATRPLSRSGWCTLVRSSLAGAVSSKPTIERSPGTDRPRSRAASRAPSASGSLNANSAVTSGARSSRAWARTRPDSTLLRGALLDRDGRPVQPRRGHGAGAALQARLRHAGRGLRLDVEAGRPGMGVGGEPEAQDREPAVAELEQVAHRGLRGGAVVDPDEVELRIRAGLDRR